MNNTELTPAQQAALEEVKTQFAVWREKKSGKALIPESLWTIAAGLFHCAGLSVSSIARSLRLNYTALKSRISCPPPFAIPEQDAAPTAATFIEMNASSCLSDCVIEMEGRSGSKMRLCFRGKVDPLLVDLGRFFLKENA